MTAQDQNEASSRISSTSLTMLSDCRNRSKIERCSDSEPESAVVCSGCIDEGLLWRLLDDSGANLGLIGRLQRRAQPGREAARPAVAADAGDGHVELCQDSAGATDALIEQQRGAAR